MADVYNLVVIGTGAASIKIAETCRQTGWRVAIVDCWPYGGSCCCAHIIGPSAEEAINLFGLAIRLDLTTEQLRHFVPAYPSAGSDIGYMLS